MSGAVTGDEGYGIKMLEMDFGKGEDFSIDT